MEMLLTLILNGLRITFLVTSNKKELIETPIHSTTQQRNNETKSLLAYLTTIMFLKWHWRIHWYIVQSFISMLVSYISALHWINFEFMVISF